MPFPLHSEETKFNARDNLISLGVGLCGGAFGGLVGLGGGIVMVPMLTAFLGLTQHKAHGTSLAALVFTGIAGATAYWLGGRVDFVAAALISAPAIFTAHSGAKYANRLSENRLKRYFGFFMVFISAMLLLKEHLPSAVAGGLFEKYTVLVLAGGATGFISGMMGVGGGSMMVPAMVLLAGMGQHVAQGTSLLAMVPAGISGTRTHWKFGNVGTGLIPGLLFGVVIGSFLGGTIAILFDERILRTILAVTLALYGSRYLKTNGNS